MRTVKIVFFTLVILIAQISCNRNKDATGPNIVTQDNVSISVQEQNLVISNNTGATIYYTVFPKSILPLILWAPCVDPESCENQIPHGQSGTISVQEALAGNEDDTLVFYWWHLVAATGGGYQIDSFSQIDIDL